MEQETISEYINNPENIEKLLNFFKDFFFDFTFHKIIFISMAFCLFGVGLFLRYLRRKHFNDRTAIPVKLKVIDHKSDRIGEDSRSVKALYEIVSGPYKGKQKLSEFGSYPPVHDIGEIYEGLYNRETDQMESQKAIKTMKNIERVLFIMAALIPVFTYMILMG